MLVRAGQYTLRQTATKIHVASRPTMFERDGPAPGPKQLLTSCFRRSSTARPPHRLVRCERCACVDEGRCRWPSSPSARKQGAARRSHRLTFERGNRCCCLRLIANMISRRQRRPAPHESCVRRLRCLGRALVPSTVHADPSRLEGPRRSTILVETAADRRDACCERAVRVRRHVRRVERAARREATMSCLTSVLWL